MDRKPAPPYEAGEQYNQQAMNGLGDDRSDSGMRLAEMGQVSNVDRSEWSAADEQNDSMETVLFVSRRFKIEPVRGAVPVEQLPVGLLAATRGELDDVHIDPALRDIAANIPPTMELPSVVAGQSVSLVSGVEPKPAPTDAAGTRPFARRVMTHADENRLLTLSIRSRADEFKKFVSKYYAEIDRKYSEHLFVFDVLIGKDKRKRKLSVDLSLGGITRFKRDGRRKKTYFPFKDLLQVVKSVRDPLMVALRLRNGKLGMVRFTSMVERERFYTVCWLGQCNFYATKTVAPRDEPVSIYVGTFNMAGTQQVEPSELWLGKLGHDIVAVCAQECNDSEFRKLIEPLTRSHVMLDMVGILYVKLAVFVRKRHIPKIRSVQHSHVATGIANVVGNKGAVAISFTFDEASFCFVGSHLAPHDKNLDERNKQFSSIVRQLKLGLPLCDIMNQFDHLFWCGDLNYRVPLKPEVSIPLIQEGNFAPLLEVDQLTQARKDKAAFIDFAEGRITFAPTFKLVKSALSVAKEGDPRSDGGISDGGRSDGGRSDGGRSDGGEDESDKKKKKKKKKKLGKVEGGYATKRNPSWCDRILWKSSPAASPMNLVEYQSSKLFVASDHNPVHAVFRTRLLLPVEPNLKVPLTLSFKDRLSATELRWPGGSEAGGIPPNIVLIFKAPFLDPTQTYYSNIKSQTFNPVWEEGEITDMPTCICDPRYLSQKSLTVLFYHFDSAFQGIIGRCVIPLGNASSPLSDASNEGVHFTTRITLHGKAVGALTGTICVFPHKPDDSA